SIFNSVTPRSAGFSSLNPAGFRDVTILFILFLMWIGGGSQSTAGGIKVNTIAAIWLNLRSIVTGREYVTAFKRSIAIGSIRRANAVVALSIVSYLIYSLILMSLEPELPTKALLFESCSALFTVGSSLGITPELCNASKILLCTAMFIGRVGIISLLMGLIGHRSYHPAKYPTDNIIIN
ncbi:MAG: potassium transporter, partial [Muribaculaceae bacterium]|nr:potassium transporter [Muribaculaceae bacterium]